MISYQKNAISSVGESWSHRENHERSKGYVTRSPRNIWWIDPALCLMFLVLPIYLISSALGGPMMSQFNTANHLDGPIIGLGVACILSMAVGCRVGGRLELASRNTRTVIDLRKNDTALVVLSVIVLAAHLVLFAAVISNPDAMLATLRAEQGAIYAAKDQITKMVGITSLVNATPIVMAMAAFRQIHFGSRMPKGLSYLFWMLVPFILMRAFVAAERFAIIEAAVAYFLPLFTFGRKRIKGVAFFPLIGISAVLIIFAFGEYTRSWPYYVDEYDSFIQFVSVRLIGYISMASNTSAGLYEYFGSSGYPTFTAAWISRIPFLNSENHGPLQEYLNSYGNAEFNNPGGIISGVLDYGIPGGLIYYFMTGIIIGYMYKLYMKSNPIGAFGYPLFYIGVPILIQAIYWGNPRFLTPLVALVVVLLFVTRKIPLNARVSI